MKPLDLLHDSRDVYQFLVAYVASWQTDKDALAQLQQVRQRIQGAAKQIIDALELSQSSSEITAQLAA